ncbi:MULTISPECIES: snapalysin family zinc-dependent metalloprotease [Amycolatopsis]|uniref:Extracellular small neutral protease n=1 Tax=Amycolatopsis dendrobii TaxID=2760662 RepID=A0A7W3VYT7_9PSEU|nr:MULTISPECIES: snapalysin family zinc-dependent metalloprotease [Amycolatopsis]MBB1155554.1 snapalysin family zinc-dependent metalloprotease [Amycolatopsis dendrobii]MCG3757311.1 snapalysin family zinc-dependent metalloprotease [Amycolatopsis sp. Poz14]UKD54509.1 snapalysin family zinc-dependent metalloprotease [Amycolatopsis sp. FU40]
MSRKFVLSGAVALALAAAPLSGAVAVAAPAPSAVASATVYYSTSGAPSFRAAINAGAANWNRAVTNVKLVERSSGATLRYVEGNDPRGSYAQTDGHGHGTIFIDYTQARQYDNTRITAHETGHALGLPDHYSGPCSELMSGGGPGPSCHNANPNSQEASRVQRLWANGLSAVSGPQQRIYDHSPVG